MPYRLLTYIICIFASGLLREAVAADMNILKAPTPVLPAWSWTGFYGGVHLAAGGGTANFSDPFGSSIFGDKVFTPGFLAGGQIGYNWQVPNSNLVLGVEGDASWLVSDGTNTCLAFSGYFVSATCRAQPNFIGDLTARVGWAYGLFNHSLIYVKGGAAVIHNQFDIATNNTPLFGLAPLTTSSVFTQVGWTVGAGVEHAITPAWSVKLEYNYAGFGGEAVATPPGIIQPAPPALLYFLTSPSTTHVTQNFQEVSLGLNYKFGVAPSTQWGSASMAVLPGAPVPVIAAGWEFELGARDWVSSGRFQKDLGSTTDPGTSTTLNSRLTYDTTANSAELFGRIEAPQNIFLKGNIGAGWISSGQLNDEDWGLPFGITVVPYSNTTSSVSGDISYATGDVGYDFFRGIGYRLGAFVGYNYYTENKSANGCVQIANPFSDCVPPIENSVLVITENDTWNSLRVGLNGNIMVTDRLKVEADVAYLPYVAFKGTDDHLLRALTIPESGNGMGLQLESILSYFVTDQLSVGVGGRYWAMWTTNNAIVDPNGSPCPCQTQPAKTDRFGVFVQLDYTGLGSLFGRFN